MFTMPSYEYCICSQYSMLFSLKGLCLPPPPSVEVVENDCTDLLAENQALFHLMLSGD
jgi:hypothetical protein